MPVRLRCVLARPTPACVFATGSVSAQDIQVYTNASQHELDLGSYPVPGGKTLELAVGIGSSLYHIPGDPADRFWALSDRGPNIACSDAEEIMGVDRQEVLRWHQAGPGLPAPGLRAVDLRDHARSGKGSFSVVRTIPSSVPTAHR